jgi:PAS domain S-box-containing protein
MSKPVPISEEAELEALLSSNDPSTVMDTVFGFTPSGVVIARASDGKVLRCSEHAARLLGLPRSILEGRLISEIGEILRTYDASGLQLPVREWPLARALRGETLNGYEYWVDGAGGRRVPLIGNAAPIRNSRGALIGAISSVTEFKSVTDYKLYEDLERRMQAAEFLHGGRSLAEVVAASMQAVLAKTNDAVITLDARGTIVLFTPAAEQLFGVPAKEALGGSISRFIPERHREAHEQHVRDFRASGETIRRMGAENAPCGLRANGDEFPMEAWISRVRIGHEIFVTVVLQDLTERELAKDAHLKTLIAREIEHRAKNALGAVQALVKLTTADTPEELKRALHERISA